VNIDCPKGGILTLARGDIVTLGGLALQAEDCAIRAALHHRAEHDGLVHMENERYYQFIIWRAVLPIWHAVLEREDATDIIVSKDGIKHYFELKNWRGKTGNDQFGSIRKDIRRLQPRENGHLLITSGNPVGQTDKNIEYILDNVDGLGDSSKRVFKFSTEKHDGSALESWIAGWPVLKSPIVAKA
jgi:hypothetical protein